jgi:hypothetical protein
MGGGPQILKGKVRGMAETERIVIEQNRFVAKATSLIAFPR